MGTKTTSGPCLDPRRAAAALVLAVTTGLAAHAAPLWGQSPFALDRDREIRLAMSAGPPSVSEQADVWVFGDSGFERVIEGTNGFACMVIRAADDPELLAPHCFSPDAVDTVLPGKLAEGELIAQGLGGDAVDAALLSRFDDGRLPLPAGNAYAYMLSSGQKLGPAGRWKPHFMIYMPYATDADVGGSRDTPWFPFVGPVVNHPHSTLVIVMTEFVSPDDVTVPTTR